MSKEKKVVAKTLTSILENPIMEIIRDKESDIEQVFDKVISWWRYDLESRKPGPAYIDENFVGTDLDLACFLFELCERNAVINIPKYKSMRAKTIKEGEAVVSSENRHGQITGLIANKDVFSFSVRIKDMNVVTSEGVGESRNFSITDLDGDWHEGFMNLGFIPTAKENKFLFENKLVFDNKIDFTNFVHPNRWSSLFGQYYIMTKQLIKRLKEESSYYFQEIKKMKDEGITYPPKDAPAEWPHSEKIPGKKIKVKSFEADLDIPDNDTKFVTYEHNQETLLELTKRRNYYTYTLVPKLNFAVRTVEYAYHKFGKNRIPSWIKNAEWQENWVVPGKRTKWDRVILFQPEVGKIGVSIKKRLFESTQEVSEKYDDRKGKLKNYIAFVLDESGSMARIWEETIGAFNQQVKTIKENANDMETLVSLVKFNTIVPEPVYWNESDSSLKELDRKSYWPNGMTALNDAIGLTIDGLKKAPDINDPLTSFLLVVVSDGDENNSKTYPGRYNEKIAQKMKEVQDSENWTITFLGANQNMEILSQKLNIPMGNVQAFAATSEGMNKASFTVSTSLNTYYDSRRDGSRSVKEFYNDSKEDKK